MSRAMTLRHIIEGCVVEAPDAEHARKLFDELTDALAQLATQKVTKVLLTCTSAMTTTFFARKLQEVAATLSLEGASMPCASTPFAKPRLQGRQPLRSAEGISLDTSAFPTRGNAFFCHPVPR